MLVKEHKPGLSGINVVSSSLAKLLSQPHGADLAVKLRSFPSRYSSRTV